LRAWEVTLENAGEVDDGERENRTDEASDLSPRARPHKAFAALIAEDRGDLEADVGHEAGDKSPADNLWEGWGKVVRRCWVDSGNLEKGRGLKTALEG
jgi:hypothetical protein